MPGRIGQFIKKWWKPLGVGLGTGVLNGLFGAGGGMVAVPGLRMSGFSVKEAHATSVAVVSVLSLLSMLLYWISGRFSPGEVWPFLPAGIVGALAGSLLFRKLSSVWLRRAFGAFVLFAAGRILFG